MSGSVVSQILRPSLVSAAALAAMNDGRLTESSDSFKPGDFLRRAMEHPSNRISAMPQQHDSVPIVFESDDDIVEQNRVTLLDRTDRHPSADNTMLETSADITVT